MRLILKFSFVPLWNPIKKKPVKAVFKKINTKDAALEKKKQKSGKVESQMVMRVKYKTE